MVQKNCKASKVSSSPAFLRNRSLDRKYRCPRHSSGSLPNNAVPKDIFQMNYSRVTSQSANRIVVKPNRILDTREESIENLAAFTAPVPEGGVSLLVSQRSAKKVNLRISTLSRSIVLRGTGVDGGCAGRFPGVWISRCPLSATFKDLFYELRKGEGLVLPRTIVTVNLCLVSRLFSHLFTRPRQKGHPSTRAWCPLWYSLEKRTSTAPVRVLFSKKNDSSGKFHEQEEWTGDDDFLKSFKYLFLERWLG